MTLHDAIICILKSHGTAMSYSDIAEREFDIRKLFKKL